MCRSRVLENYYKMFMPCVCTSWNWKIYSMKQINESKNSYDIPSHRTTYPAARAAGWPFACFDHYSNITYILTSDLLLKNLTYLKSADSVIYWNHKQIDGFFDYICLKRGGLEGGPNIRQFANSMPAVRQALLRQVMWSSHMTYCFLLKQYRGVTIESQRVQGGDLL